MRDVNNSEILIYETDVSRRFNNFLKGLAIFCIVLTHSHQLFGVPELLFNMLDILQVACQAFFVISAFGLCLSFDNKKVSWFSFMKHRLSKIAVAYWLMIAYYIVYEIVRAIVIGKNIISSINFPGVIINFLFLNGLVPVDFINNHIVSGGWFIGTLVLMYALFPLMFACYNVKHPKWQKIRPVIFPFAMFMVSFTIINVAGCFDANLSTANPFIYRFVLNQLPCFAVGFSLYDLYKNKKLHTLKYPLLLFAIFAFVGAVLFYLGLNWCGSVFPFVFSVGFVFLYAVLSRCTGLIKKLCFDNRSVAGFFEHIGKSSLYIYLVQSIVNFYLADGLLYLIRPYCGNELLLYLLLLPLLVFLSIYSGKLFSKILSK